MRGGGHCIAVDPYFLTADFPEQTKVIATAREVNNHKALWCAERIKNAVLEFKLSNKRPPVVALMGLAFKPNIDDMRESPAKMIAGLVLSQVAGAKSLCRSRTSAIAKGWNFLNIGMLMDGRILWCF